MCCGGGGARLLLAEGLAAGEGAMAVRGEGAMAVEAGRTVAVAFMSSLPVGPPSRGRNILAAWL
jgi:hypothetical protein